MACELCCWVVCKAGAFTHLGLLGCLLPLGVIGDCGKPLKFWPPHPTACLSCASACQGPGCR